MRGPDRLRPAPRRRACSCASWPPRAGSRSWRCSATTTTSPARPIRSRPCSPRPASTCSTATPGSTTASASPARRAWAAGSASARSSPGARGSSSSSCTRPSRRRSSWSRRWPGCAPRRASPSCTTRPIAETVEGEPREIYPFLGSSRLEEPLLRYPVAAVFHGHAHRGRPEGRTRDGVPVYNVCLPLLREADPARPFRLLELGAAAPVGPSTR